MLLKHLNTIALSLSLSLSLPLSPPEAPRCSQMLTGAHITGAPRGSQLLLEAARGWSMGLHLFCSTKLLCNFKKSHRPPLGGSQRLSEAPRGSHPEASSGCQRQAHGFTTVGSHRFFISWLEFQQITYPLPPTHPEAPRGCQMLVNVFTIVGHHLCLLNKSWLEFQQLVT